ncbi:hypothetical protein N8935_08505 [Amylibacter sp.]|nr:hypothetical protein [Amylibacter sp.]
MVPNLRFIGLCDRGTLRWVRLCLTTPIKVIPDTAFSLNGRLPVPFETGPMSSKLKCGYATHNGQWDMEVNPKWVASMKQAGFDLEMCLFFLAN